MKLLLLLLLAPAAALAQSKWGAHLDFEAKPGTKRSLGEGDLFVPLWQDGRTLAFGNLRARFDDGGGREGNLGAGLRRMHDSGWNLGGYGYLDRRKSENGNYFGQAAFGAEALGRDWDLRANAYVPRGERVRTLGSTTAVGASTASLVGTTVFVTTPGGTTMTSEERALKGFDVEVGWRAPVFDVESTKQVRVYAGGYRFKDDVTKVAGPRLRVELAMAEVHGLWEGAQLTLSAEAQHDDPRGSHGFVALRLRVPLGGRAEQARLNWQERRMTAPVVRDVDIVTQARSAVTAVQPATVETAAATLGGQPVTIVDSGTTSGANLPAAVTAAGAGSVVLLSGTFNTSASVVMQTGQTLMGAGTLTAITPSGRSATFTTPSATVSWNGSGPNFRTILAASNTTITGLTLAATSTGSVQTSAIIVDSGINNVRITNNVLTSSNAAAGRAQAILLFNATNVTVSGNTLSGSATGANDSIGLHVVGGSATVTGNSMTASGSASNNYVLLNTTTILSGSDGNVRGSGVCNTTGSTGSIGFTDGSSC